MLSALVRRGEAVGEVIATGIRTKFGRIAELVRSARVDSSEQKAVLRVGGQDPVDAAIRAAAARQPVTDEPELMDFLPFDPTVKRSEAMVR
jgi:magnesium-transporting ATPase (P-type)